jgi:HK97 family phage major capsid protein
MLGDLRDSRILNIAEGTGSAGGFLVPTFTIAEVLQRLKFYSAVASACKLIPTATGATWSWPTVDETSVGGVLLAENAALSVVDVTFGSVSLGAFKFSSGIVPVSFEILQDMQVDITAFLMDLLAKRLGRVENTYATTGTGSAQPQGIVGSAASGFVLPTGNTTTLTYNGLVALYESVDAVYRSAPGAAFMMNDLTLLAIKNLADTTNARPLWLPDVLPEPPGSPQHGTLFGKPVWINPDMASMAANAKCILFGDMEQFAFRQVRGMAIMQLSDSAYASKGQAAFLAFGRMDSDMISGSNNAIKYLQNSAT